MNLHTLLLALYQEGFESGKALQLADQLEEDATVKRMEDTDSYKALVDHIDSILLTKEEAERWMAKAHKEGYSDGRFKFVGGMKDEYDEDDFTYGMTLAKFYLEFPRINSLLVAPNSQLLTADSPEAQ